MIKRFGKKVLCMALAVALLAPSFCIEIKADEKTDETYTEVKEIESFGNEDKEIETVGNEDNELELVSDESADPDKETDDDISELIEYEFTSGYVEAPGETDFESPGEVGGGDALELQSELPPSYTTSYLPQTRDQNPYGTCWAHSAMALAEIGQNNIYGDTSRDYSELQLAYFYYHTPIDPLGGLAGDDNTNIITSQAPNYLDAGGNLDSAGYVLANWIGIVNESDVPYPVSTDKTYAPASIDSKYAYDNDVLHLKNFYRVNPVTDRDNAKRLIMEYGALGVSYFALNPGYQVTIDGTTIKHTNVYNSSTYAYYFPVKCSTNHAVTIVGWDDNFSKSNFVNDPGHDGAWLIRNSWDSSATSTSNKGLDTYFWLSYYDKSLYGAAYAYEFDDADNYDNNYQYDGAFFSGYSESHYAGSKWGNLFTAKESENGEKIKAVAFSTSSANQEYNIDIYVGIEEGTDGQATNISPGTPAASLSGTVTYAGYHTIELPNPIYIDGGEKFSVVVNLPFGKMDMENTDSNLTSSSYAHIEPGTSFELTGSGWADASIDANGFGNYRIKAFTDDCDDIYKVTLDANGGNVTPSIVKVTYGEMYENLPTPTRDGYDFAGWNTETDGSGTDIEEGDTVEIEDDHTLYAKWTPKTYTLYFNANGGTCATASKTVTFDAAYDTLPIPTRDGYKFEYWYILKSGVISVQQKISSTDKYSQIGDLTVYAKWTPLQYTVSFDANGGTCSTENKSVTFDSTYGTLPTPGRTGYTFAGWYTAATGGSKVTSGTKMTTAGDHNLYAHWNGASIKVTFNANGGSCKTSSKNVTVEGTYGTLPEATHATRDFAGWYTQAEDGEKITASSSVTATTAHKLYAHWTLRTMTTPTMSPSSGSTVSFGDIIRISSSYSGGKIYYTVDGSAPTTGSSVYAATGITVDASMIKKSVGGVITVKAFSTWAGEYNPSNVVTYTYNVVNDFDTPGDIVSEDEEYLRAKLTYMENHGDIPSGEGTLSDVIPAGLWIAGLSEYDSSTGIESDKAYEYSGSAIKPVIRVYDGKKLLTEKIDYTVAYKNNTNEGNKDSVNAKGVSIAPTVTVTGKGNYKGSDTATFTILPRSLNDCEVTASVTEVLTYTGKNQQIIPTVMYGKKKLANKKDYTVKYYSSSDDIEATPNAIGAYYVSVTGIGNYKDNISDAKSKLSFNIINKDPKVQKAVSKLTLEKIKDQLYTGSPIDVNSLVIVKDGKDILNNGTDYYVSHSDNITDIGVVSVTIKGNGTKYFGTKTVTFKITGTPLSKAKINGFVSQYSYTGGAITQENLDIIYQADKKSPIVTLVYKTKTEYNGLSNDEEKKNCNCIVEYQNNTNAGTATMVLTGVNGYTGTVKKTFKINPYDISKLSAGDITLEGGDTRSLKYGSTKVYPYEKSGVKPKPVVKFEGAQLREGVDYTVAYQNNTAVNMHEGAANKLPTVKITGKGNFKGTNSSACYAIKKAMLHDPELGIVVTAPDKIYANKAGNWKTTVTVTDRSGKKLAPKTDYNAAIEYYYESIPDEAVVYDGSSKERNKPIAYRSNGDEVENGDIVPAGTVIRVVVWGSGGNYDKDSSALGYYRVAANDINKCKASVQTYTYTGRAIEPGMDAIKLTMGTNSLTEDDFEIVGYKNNITKGTATVTVRGKGNYGGTKNISFKIDTKGFAWWCR